MKKILLSKETPIYCLVPSEAIILDDHIEGYFNHGVNLKEGDVVVDVGANIGILGLELSRKYPTINIHSFEPIEDIYSVLKANTNLSNNKNFQSYNFGISDKNELKGEFYNTTKENFNRTMLISSFSLTEISREAQHLMDKNGGSILTLSYIGGKRTTPNYNVMGVAKAALECSVRYLSVDLGKKNIRINSLSSGPMRTLAGAAISGARHVFRHSEKNSPLNKNPSLIEVSKSSLYLLSDLSSGVTGENHFVDGGYNIIAVPKE